MAKKEKKSFLVDKYVHTAASDYSNDTGITLKFIVETAVMDYLRRAKEDKKRRI